MSDVQPSRSTTPARSVARAASPVATGNLPPQADVRAMSDAFVAARTRLAREGAAGQPRMPTARSALGTVPQGDPRDAVLELAARSAAERNVAERQGERQADAQGLAMMPPPAPPAPAAVAVPTATPVDPSTFAQMLADLWTRENGRGTKTVQVRFGADAWPATGATLVKTADGLLDVAVTLGAPTHTAPQALARGLADAGLSIGQVRFDEGE